MYDGLDRLLAAAGNLVEDLKDLGFVYKRLSVGAPAVPELVGHVHLETDLLEVLLLK